MKTTGKSRIWWRWSGGLTVACVLAFGAYNLTVGSGSTSARTGSPSPEPTAQYSLAAGVTPVTGPAVASGTFKNSAGVGVPGLTVTLSAADAGAGAPIGRETVLPVLGRVRTGAGGHWKFVLPDPLPPAVQPLADTNGGVLNLLAFVSVTGTDGRPMMTTDSLAVGVAEGAATTQASADARANFTPNVVVMRPHPGS